MPNNYVCKNCGTEVDEKDYEPGMACKACGEKDIQPEKEKPVKPIPPSRSKKSKPEIEPADVAPVPPSRFDEPEPKSEPVDVEPLPRRRYDFIIRRFANRALVFVIFCVVPVVFMLEKCSR